MSAITLTAQSIFWPKQNSILKQTLTIAIGVVLLAIGSQLSIPLFPVPLTFQSATVILIGMALGARQGAAVVASYLLVGALGLPVFADFSAGLDKFFGPTGGYLLGFLPAAYLSGYLAEKGFSKTILGSFVATLCGVSIIFLGGLSYLSLFLGWEKAIAVGLLPFVVSEAVKLFVIALFTPKMWKQI